MFALLRCQSLKQGLRRWGRIRPTPGPQCDSLSPGAAAEAGETGDVTGQAARRTWREALRHAKQRRLFNARLLGGGHRDSGLPACQAGPASLHPYRAEGWGMGRKWRCARCATPGAYAGLRCVGVGRTSPRRTVTRPLTRLLHSAPIARCRLAADRPSCSVPIPVQMQRGGGQRRPNPPHATPVANPPPPSTPMSLGRRALYLPRGQSRSLDGCVP